MRQAAGVAAAVGGLLAGWAAAGEVENAARKILERNQDAVVWVSAVVKTEITGMGVQMGHGREQKVEALGTVVDPSGLVVASASMLDPMGMIGNLAISMGGEDRNIVPRSQTSDVKIRFADDTEVPAKLVLTDPELDVVFVVPEKPLDGGKAVSVDLAQSATAGILDAMISVGRLGKSLDRQPSVAVGHIEAVVRKPRTFYCVDQMAGGMGTPVFAQDGRILGILLMRKAADRGGLGSLLGGGGMQPVVLPAEDLRELAQQALAAKDKPAAEAKPDAAAGAAQP